VQPEGLGKFKNLNPTTFWLYHSALITTLLHAPIITANNMSFVSVGGAVMNATRNNQVTVTLWSIEMEKVSF
jgi:hypothetical protein